MLSLSLPSKVFALLIVLALVIYVTPANGQFLITSSDPAQGETNVALDATFSITFNAPIDTSARFPFPEDFFMNIYFYPDYLIGEPDTITASPDLRTIYIHNLHLSPNTAYSFIILNAVSQSGDSLDRPYSIIFTTGNGLPTGSVSGTASYPGNDPAGALVALFDSNPFGDDDANLVNPTVIQNSSGDYTIDYVEDGTYWVVAAEKLFVRPDGEIDLTPGGAIGFFDSDGDRSPDSIVVSGGAPISGIGMTLFDLIAQTARSPYPNVESLAQNWAGDAYLVGAGGDAIQPDGASLFWQYAFYSPSLTQHRAWVAMGNMLAMVKGDTMTTDTASLPQNWLDSDAVMAAAEANGGSDFRQQYSDADVYAFLGHFSFQEAADNSPSGDSKIARIGDVFSRTNINLSETTLHFAPNSDNQLVDLPAVWGVDYYSDSAGVGLFLLVDAVTGTVLNAPATAAVAEQKALPLAQNWQADAKLWQINNGDSVDPQGNAEMWWVTYYSPGIDSLHQLLMWGQVPIFQGPAGFQPPDTITVAPGWLDSDACIAAAEAAGGSAYRSSNQDVQVGALLSRWFFGPNPQLTVWQFYYTSSTAPELQITVNAPTGNVITGINDPDPSSLPDRFMLYQNYPNPFNPATTIRYYLPTAERVSIEIFNVSGQKVATLVEARQTPGFHEVQFDASQLASGVYIYRLTTPTQFAMKKMILIK